MVFGFTPGFPISVAADPGPEAYGAPFGNDSEPGDLERHLSLRAGMTSDAIWTR